MSYTFSRNCYFTQEIPTEFIFNNIPRNTKKTTYNTNDEMILELNSFIGVNDDENDFFINNDNNFNEVKSELNCEEQITDKKTKKVA